MGNVGADEAGKALVAAAGDGLDLARPALASCLLEGGGAHGNHLLRVGALHRGDGVAGIDRAGEGVGALDRENIGQLHHVEQSGDARRDILAGGGGGDEEGVVTRHQFGDERRDILGEAVGVGRIVGDVDLADAGDLRSGLGDRADARSGDDQMDLAELRRGGYGGQGGVLELPLLMLDPDERLHPITPVSLILPISSSTEPTLIPACRFGGSATFNVVSLGAVSTP
jgi:hypothetical protein